MRLQNILPTQIIGILSVLVGTSLGFAALRGLLLLIPYQPPIGVGPTSGNAYNVWVSSLPTEGYQLILGCFLGGAFVGGVITALIAQSTRYYFAPLVTGFLLVVMCIGQFLAFTHPEWMTYSSCIGMVIFAWLGGKIIKRTKLA